MRTLLVLLFLIFANRSHSQNEYRLFFNPKVHSAKLYEAPRLIKSDQLYDIKSYKDSVVISNNALRFVMLKESTLVYFDDKFEGEFVSQNIRNWNHFIIYFVESKTYYFFHYNI